MTPVVEIGLDDGDDAWPYIAINGVHVAERRPHKDGNYLIWVAVAPGWQVIGGDTGKSGELPSEIIGPDGPVALQ